MKYKEYKEKEEMENQINIQLIIIGLMGVALIVVTSILLLHIFGGITPSDTGVLPENERTCVSVSVSYECNDGSGGGFNGQDYPKQWGNIIKHNCTISISPITYKIV